ncbi:MAG: fimbrillin family protein [Alistipes sp.]|jgi:uncharacterized protein (TIGR02145 family)|nr:fimbrillin family protein [Alistipes sp.]
MRKILYLALFGVLATVALLLAGCSNERATETPAQAVRFSATLPDATRTAATRTTPDGDAWLVGDSIGISATGGAQNGATNKLFVIANPATGALEPVDGMSLYYPQTGTVDFTAIYPWRDGTADSYTVRAADQTDALYARTAGVAASTDAVQLAFRHLMSKITLNVRADRGVSSSEVAAMIASEVVFGGMPARATFDLTDGSLAETHTGEFSPVKAASPEGRADATFTTILVPQPDGASGRSIAFTLGGETFSWRIPSSHDFDAGRHYVYPVTIRRGPASNPGISVTVGTHTIADWQVFEGEGGEAEEIPAVTVGNLIWAGLNVSTPGHFADSANAYDGANQYTWEEATSPYNGTGTDGSICPAGWRMPTRDEYVALMAVATNIGSSESSGDLSDSGYYTTNPGWVDSEPKGMNVETTGGTLFFPASGYNAGQNLEGMNAYYWSSTPIHTRGYYMYFNGSVVHPANSYMTEKLSVRCVRDKLI